MTAPVALVEADASRAAALLAPFDEQTGLDVAAGRRVAYACTAPDGSLAGAVVLGAGAVDLHIRQELRARGLGAAAAAAALARAGAGDLTAWSHEDHPAAAALARRFGFARARVLLQLERRLDGPAGPETPAARAPRPAEAGGAAPERIDSFRPGADDADWLALNARVFAWHPEQGRLTAADLAERVAEPWFRADDFLIARDAAGVLLGYNWLKIDPANPAEGEVYVLGVAPEAAGAGLGRRLTEAGLARLAARGCRVATLFVEGDNDRAVGLYRSLGFTDRAVHVQYHRAPIPENAR